jgi:acetate kinase
VNVLVVNAGSSSLKLRLVGGDDALLGSEDVAADDVAGAVERLGRPDAVGHRIVHGGTDLVEPTVIDAAVVERLRALTDLAPLHQPKSLDALDAVTRVLPDVPAVACFDTAFHATLSDAAATYAVPRDWWRRLDVRRYGFHGLSHAWAARRAASLLGAEATRRLVTCHLGAGASLCAVRDGRSVDTTMGFTPLEGLVMATRSGTVDPGLVLWLLERAGMSARELQRALEHESGMLALAGTADMREVLARDDADARLALDVYVHRLRGGIAAMAAACGGLDALVFTGGVGERAAPVRAAAAGGLAFLGVAIDADANAVAEPDAEITAPGARVRTLVLAAREDLEIAHGTRAALGVEAGAGAAAPLTNRVSTSSG